MATRPTPDTAGVDDPGPGRRLGIDVGTVRIGVALSDRDATLAMPLDTVRRQSGFSGPDGSDIDELIAYITDYDVKEIVVGLPRNLSGKGSVSVKHAKEIAFRIRRRLQRAGTPIPVRYADERLTTVVAQQSLHAAGRTTRTSRQVVDQAAAVAILQSWLDARRNTLERHNGYNPVDTVNPGVNPTADPVEEN